VEIIDHLKLIFTQIICVIANNTGNEFIFDLYMLDALKNKGWYEEKGYLRSNETAHKVVYAHHYVAGYPLKIRKYHTDHIDGNKKNNLSKNLRVVPAIINIMNSKLQKNNTSGFKGVRYHKGAKKWLARIGVNRKDIHLGLFKTAQEAAIAYDKKAYELYGEDALTNKKMGLL